MSEPRLECCYKIVDIICILPYAKWIVETIQIINFQKIVSLGLKYRWKCTGFVPKTCFQPCGENFTSKYQRNLGKFLEISLQNVQNWFRKWFWAQIRSFSRPDLCPKPLWIWVFGVLRRISSALHINKSRYQLNFSYSDL